MNHVMDSRSARLACIFLCTMCSPQIASSHKQPVHQYIAREAYSLLISDYQAAMKNPLADIPPLSAFIGLADPSYAGDSAWQKGFVTTGAWREDEEDVVYHYDILPGLNYPLTSITHFWDADQGDETKSMFRLEILHPPLPPVSTDIGPYENAFMKIMMFAHGGWVLWYPRTMICQNTANNHVLVITPVVSAEGFGIPVAYTNLTSLYTGRKLTVRSDAPAVCAVADVNDLKTINLCDVKEIRIAEGDRDIIVWEILGRMCHLLGDMSVPAHAHRDEHGLNPDSYEEYMGGADEPYKVWDHTNAGYAIILNDSIDGNVNDDSILHFLMFVMQQQSDHFGSNGPAQGSGNNTIGGNATRIERNFLTWINLGSLGGPTTDAGPWTTDSLNVIRDKTFPFVIRATAGLLYWFCHATGLMNNMTTAAPNEHWQPLTATPTLSQNYPNPFNPTTVVSYQVPAVSMVHVVVYNVLGNEVAILVNAMRRPGSYTVTFDGNGLPSGTYFCRLQASAMNGGNGHAYVDTRKMILLK